MPKDKPIFDNAVVEELAVEYQNTKSVQVYQDICAETYNMMDAIIRSKRYHLKVDFNDLKNYLFLQFERWILGWRKDGKAIFTYFSACIRNGCLSYLAKESQYEQRFAVTDSPLDVLSSDSSNGSISDEDSQAFKESVNKAVEDMTCRWDAKTKEVIRYLVSCVMRERSDRRKQIITTACYGWDMDIESVKFLLDWSSGAVRKCVLDAYNSPLGESDIARIAERFTFIPDIIDLIGIKHTGKLLTVFAGISVRFPSMQQVRRWVTMKNIYENMANDGSPAMVKSLARKHRMSPAKVQTAFNTVVESIQEGRLEDLPVFTKDNPLPSVDVR